MAAMSSILQRFVNMLTDFGKIKIGERAEGSGKPKKLDYFKILNLRGDDYREVLAVYPTKPKELIVTLPYDKFEDNFNAFMAAYRPQDIFERCVGRDGKAVRKWKPMAELRQHKFYNQLMEKFAVDGKLSEVIECPEMECPYAKIRYGQDGKIQPSPCKMHCKVAFSILDPANVDSTPEKVVPIPNVVGGIFRLRTTGLYTVSALVNSAAMIAQRTYKNVLAGVPLRLKLEFMKAGNNYDVPRIYLTSLASDEQLFDLSKTLEQSGRRIVFHRTNMSIEEEIMDIVNTEDHEEVSNVAAEFHPVSSAPVATETKPKSMNLAGDMLGDVLKKEVESLPVTKVELAEETKEEVKAAVVHQTQKDPETNEPESESEPKKRGRPRKEEAVEPGPEKPPVPEPPIDNEIPF